MTTESTTSVSADVTAYITMPVGTISPFAGTEAPNGWLLCNGQAIVQTSYPLLYALVGGNVPDLRSRFIVGSGQGAGLDNYPINSKGGLETVTLNINQLPAHSHTINNGNFGLHWRSFKGSDDSDIPYETNPTTRLNGTDNTGGGQSHENRPPYYALTYIIKY